MSWRKIDIPPANMVDIQEQAGVIWSAFRSPKRFALFCSREKCFPTTLFFSPLAADICNSIIEKHKGVECGAPVQEEVSFLLGHDEDIAVANLPS